MSFNFMAAVTISVILEPNKVKYVTVSPFICHEVMGPNAMIFFFFECWVLCQLFHSPLSLSSKDSFEHM